MVWRSTCRKSGAVATGEGFYVTPRVAEESFMDADERCDPWGLL